MPEAQAIDVAPRPVTDAKDVRDAAGRLPQSRSKNNGLAASVNENGCFESDRVIKCGYVERRTQKTRKWKTVYIVLRPNTLSVYKNEKETKLRHQVYLSDLTAVAFLKDPKHKRQNVFGLFSPSKNFHFQAPTAQDAQEWVDLIRKEARIDDDDDDEFLASPLARSLSPNALVTLGPVRPGRESSGYEGDHVMLSSSPEPNGPPGPFFAAAGRRESFNNVDWSGNELPSHSDLSDNEGPLPLGASLESLTIQPPLEASSLPRGGTLASRPPVNRSLSQASVLNDKSKSNKNGTNSNADADPERVIWHGWLWMLRSKRGVRQWKNMWAVLRPRNLILYKDESEYAVQWLVQLSAVVNVVDIDPLSKSKQNCLQIITEEKSYRFCARDEESLVQFIGAFKSLLAKRRGFEVRGPPPARATPLRLDDQARGQGKTE
ncbi:PH domain-containing protein [Hirsutella rhossiliensis]|uniref:PH domain-containing protein n=1 Tax=Hirsutella rhossiliensis TaxID=111463 RepID=A0A9P8SFA9_9HYPO|nr:PH domain-containing protein [Hirsutella rhossiliensis]KAH0960556.1 PH domain-containing protein [Hirsutella rhossiliensis]